MVATTRTEAARERIDTGLKLLGNAVRDALRGAVLVTSGLALLLVAGVMGVRDQLAQLLKRFRTQRDPSIERRPRHAGLVWDGLLRSRLAGWVLVVVVVSALVALTILAGQGIHALLAIAGQLAMAAIVVVAIVIPIFLTLGALRMVGAVFRWAGGAFSPAVIRLLSVAAFIVLLGAFAAAVFRTFELPPLIMLIAGVSVLAGAAGIAIVSFGPTRWSFVSLGGAKREALETEAIDVDFEPVGAMAGLPPPRRAIGASPKTSATRSSDTRRVPVYALLSSIAGLFLVAGGAFLATQIPANFGEQVMRAVTQVAPSSRPDIASPENPVRAVAIERRPLSRNGLVELVLDGAPGQAAWRHGYRRAVVRLADNTGIGKLSLPPGACSTSVILAIGTASSDGALAANQRLAQRRALWLAQWTRGQLAACAPSHSAPAVLAVSAGQTNVQPAQLEQRQLRLLALSENSGFRFSASAATDFSEATRRLVPELSAFPDFEICTASPGAIQASGLPLPCQLEERS